MADPERADETAESTASDLVTAAFDALPAQIAIVDEDGIIERTNQAWRMFGVDNDLQGDADMVGEDYLAVCDASNDETGARAAEGIRAVLAGEREEFSLEYPCHSPTQQRWFLMRALSLPVSDRSRALVMHIDITDRKAAELRVEARNETLSTVAGVLSHDLRNPLNVALARAEHLTEVSDPDADTVAENTDAILSALRRMNAIIGDAVVLARDTAAPDPEQVALGSVARDAWSHVATGDATLEVAADGHIEADASLLSQLFENLFRNSTEHGTPSANGRETDDSADGDGSGPGDGLTVTVGLTADGFYVADDGPGVPVDDRESVFEVGYTTNADSGGTGMGLAIVNKIAAAHDWSVRLGPATPDAEDSGARFEFGGVTVLGLPDGS
jgi:signal transduction histidine kinase